MEVELVTEESSDDENCGFDDDSEDYLNLEGERCGICMDVVIDRGVLDCCLHWFCFECIDNWATITSLCPLCQNEFQLITCVPVYDTVGGSKTDDGTNQRDDDWFLEGKSNNVSFPSYYIDENAVVCLDRGGCKIRNGSVPIEEDSDIDTSIACDSCDKWYHAFCVGFDPEGNCDSSWLCARCTDIGPIELNKVSGNRKSFVNGSEVANDSFVDEAFLSGRVSVSVADDGETAVVVSLIDDYHQESQESSQSAFTFCDDKDKGNTVLLPSSVSTLPKPEPVLGDKESVEPPNSCEQETTELNLSPHAVFPSELNTNADGLVEVAPICSTKKMTDSDLDLDFDMKDNYVAANKVPQLSEPNKWTEDPKPAASTGKMVPDDILDEKLSISGITCAKRKNQPNRFADGVTEANVEAKIPRKKMKTEKNSQSISNIMDQTARDESARRKHSKEKEIDIKDIVQESYHHKSLKKTIEGESGARLRVKKIMRARDDKDSLMLIQELRQKIREAVRNKSSEKLGQNLFDPKLLDAFRAAFAGQASENNMKPPVDVRAKRSLLQKGKIRESLTKKIYGAGGKRKRAWTRECEVEFWKHRCIKTSKPEKVQALKSVLDVLRDNNCEAKETLENEEKTKGSSILSRVYLADTSVFPRKNDIKPVGSNLMGKNSVPLTKIQCEGNSRSSNSSSQFKTLRLNDKETTKSVMGVKPESGFRGSLASASGHKNTTTKSDIVRSDKRQWALDLLARKTASSGQNVQEKEENNEILKGNFTLLAQVPKEMRPVLAASRHNKIPISVRQMQLYRFTEHFLKKANVLVVCRSAETELAIADAVNVEKQVADRSHSKLVYLNLCSQEFTRRADDINTIRANEMNPCSISECPSDGATEKSNNNDNHDSSLDVGVEEALRRAGLLSDSPPASPNHPVDKDKACFPYSSDDEGPENVIESVSQSELDIYGDFEYNLEDGDFIGAGSLNTNSKPQPESPKLKLLFSIKPEKSNIVVGDENALVESSGPVESQSDSGMGEQNLDEGLAQNSGVDNEQQKLLVAECQELYGPDKELLIGKCPLGISVKSFETTVKGESSVENGDDKTLAKSDQTIEGSMEGGTAGSDQAPSIIKEKKNAVEKETKSNIKQSENSMITKKVEAYIKEHIRPLCKSGVITVEQYRWAVGKTTEKVMKYHSNEKNANFLIREGEKVKKLAEQYVEASQQKTTTKA